MVFFSCWHVAFFQSGYLGGRILFLRVGMQIPWAEVVFKVVVICSVKLVSEVLKGSGTLFLLGVD
jgi:hypothetical protein